MIHLSEIEDAVSDAMVRAIKTWSIGEVPDSPAAWLYSVSSRILIDVLRRKKFYYEKVAPEYKLSYEYENESEDQYSIIKLMLWCAHPDLSSKDQLGLMLQLVSGFSIKEISGALIMKPEALKKRLQRARAKLKSIESDLVLPELSMVEDRFPMLRSAIYLGFNEGYYSINSENIIREDLIYEALRLIKLLCQAPHQDIGISHALMALLLYHTSRIPARRTEDNSLILLENQDRKLWDQSMIKIANNYMGKAMNSDYYTPYHIEAVIAGIHTQTEDYTSTDWKTIADLYSKLQSVDQNPIVQLNYAFSLLNAGEIEKSMSILKSKEAQDFGVHQYLFYSVWSNAYEKSEDAENQKLMLWKAIDTAPNEATRSVLKDRMSKIV
ncbi:MAG: RNA polymerase sigma-70 factor (ECF subfamily) [Halioglobus sp.]|jgi:RNA polymerase sigma-70 factor (ECF subfamily)